MASVTVLADDLTGALDAGVQFSGKGAAVAWTPVSMPVECTIYDTGSRAFSPVRAGRAIVRWASCAAGFTIKKIDSTLRGPFVAEATALVRELGRRGAVVAPSFPQVGRRVEGGSLTVDGVPLHLTAFARDPGWPARESDVRALLWRRLGQEPGYLPLAVIRDGVEATTAALRGLEGLVVADAVTDEDLDTLAQVLEAEREWLPVGSAGLAGALARRLGYPPARRPRLPLWGRFVVVSGSAQPVNWRQIEHLRQASGATVYVSDGKAELPTEAPEGTMPVVVTLPQSRLRREHVGATRRAALAWLAQVVEEWQPRGVFITGGMTLSAALAALGVNSLALLGEADPGVVVSRARLPRTGQPLLVVSKAGGFGSDDLLTRLFCPASEDKESL